MARVIYGGAQRGGTGMGEDFSTARAARRQRSSPERGVPAPKGRYSLRYIAHKDQKAEKVLTGLGNEGRTGAAGLAVSSGESPMSAAAGFVAGGSPPPPHVPLFTSAVRSVADGPD